MNTKQFQSPQYHGWGTSDGRIFIGHARPGYSHLGQPVTVCATDDDARLIAAEHEADVAEPKPSGSLPLSLPFIPGGGKPK